MNKKQQVFCISDGTGITAQTLSQSLLSQFENIEFFQTNLPYINSVEKASEVQQRIEKAYQEQGQKPIVFTTMIQPRLAAIIHKSPGLILDCMQSFIEPLEKTLGCQSSHTIGRSHGMVDYEHYKHRIDALNFSLKTDDGASMHQYAQADLILMGVSRSGKTPTSLYLAMHHGLFVANYPMTEEDLQRFTLPPSLKAHKSKLFGLTIDRQRLVSIRNERKPHSRYASNAQCHYEIKQVEKLFHSLNMPFLNSTHLSIEELSTKIVVQMDLKKKTFGGNKHDKNF